MEYTYVAIDEKGGRQKGLIEANNEKGVAEFLRANKLTPLKIKSSSKGLSFLPSIFKPVKNSDIVLFTRQLSSMILTGLTLIESLEVLKKQTDKPAMQNIINNLISNVSEGNSFSHALSNHRDVFSDVYIALVRAAESGGLLDKVLERLATNLEKSEDLKGHIKNALFYPSIIITGVVGVIVIMNIFVIPQLGGLYESLDIELPLITRIVLGISKMFTAFSPIMVALLVALFFLYKRLSRTEVGRKTIDKIKLRLPVLGSIFVLSILDEISRTLSLLISSGASILEALTITSNVAGNSWYRDAVRNTGTLVEKGVNLSSGLEHQNLFPPVLIQMVRVGEATGKIDEGLLKVSEYFERDLDLKVKTLTTSIEPILIVVLGGTVAFLILSVITPIYGLISQIQ